MYDIQINYDEKKWLEAENRIHNLYSSHPDPRSAEAGYSVANIISDAFPTINRNEAMRNSSQIIENFTGYKLDNQAALTEMMNTMKAQKSDLDVSMKFSDAMLSASMHGFDSDQYKQKINEAMEEMSSQKLPYRSDFKDMSMLTDLLVESGRLIPSMIPSMGMYLAGGALAGVTGGASLLAAKAGGAIYSGMMEAGSVAKDLFSVKDDNGNGLGNDYILSAWALTMAGVGALNLVTDQFEKMTGGIGKDIIGKVSKKLFNKEATRQMVKSGAVKKWGSKFLINYGVKGIGGESAEEAVEELIGMAATNYSMNNSNQNEKTIFEGYSKNDIVKAMAQTAVSTAKGMVLTGFPSSAVETIRQYRASDTGLKLNANKYSGYSDNSFAMPVSDIATNNAPADAKVKKSEVPLQVVKVGDSFKPVDSNVASTIESLKKNGAKALNVEIVNNESTFNKESVKAAVKFGENAEKPVKNGVVIFDNQAEMKKAAEAKALEIDEVIGYHEAEGQIILDHKSDDGAFSIVFQTKEFNEKQNVQKNETPVSDQNIAEQVSTEETEMDNTPDEQLMQDEAIVTKEEEELNRVINEESTDPADVMKKEYSHYQRTLKRKGATAEEMAFLDNTVLKQIHDSIKELKPEASEAEIYETAIPSTYFAFLASKVAGMDTKEFFGKHFDSKAFTAISKKQEKKFLSSAQGKKSVDVELGNGYKGKFVLNGLTYNNNGKHTIGLAEHYTPLTAVHEMGHTLVDVIQDTEEFKPFMEIYKNELGQDGGKIGTHFQEAFSKDLEQYFIDGKIKDSSLKTIFKKIKDTITDFLHMINPMLDASTRKAFDKLFDIKLEDSTTESKSSVSSNPQIELDLFGDPEEVADTLASLQKFTNKPVNSRQIDSIDKFDFVKNEGSDIIKHEGDKDDARTKNANQKLGTGRTVREQINEGYGVSEHASEWESSYERALPLKLWNQRGRNDWGDGIGNSLGLQGPGSQGELGGNGGPDNQGSSGIWDSVDNNILASITRDVDLDSAKKGLAEGYYVPDDTLEALKGDPDIDWEIQFRRIMLQDSDIYKKFTKAFEKAEDEVEEGKEVTPEQVLQILERSNSIADFEEMKNEVGDTTRFINRLIAQTKYVGPERADRMFRIKLSEDEYLKEVVKEIVKGENYFTTKLPSSLMSLGDAIKQDKVTDYKINQARKELRSEIREYRRNYYTKKGMYEQLSYETQVEGSYLDNGNRVEAFGNEEIKNLLSNKDTDPVIKSLIRKNLANGDVLKTLIDQTTKQIEDLELELINVAEEADNAKNEMWDSESKREAVEKDFEILDRKYRKLQDTNKLNSERKRMYKKLNQLKAKRIQYMMTQRAIEKHVKSIKGVINSKSTSNDARTMHTLKGAINAMLNSNGEDLTMELKSQGISIDQIPEQLQYFFTVNDDGIFADNPSVNMDVKRLAELNAAVLAVRREARAIKAMREMEFNKEIFKTVKDYALDTRGVLFKTNEERQKYMAEQKLAGNVKDSKHKIRTAIETRFITMSRIIDKIDPSGATLRPYIFGGFDKDGVFHRGIEGVVDDESREEYRRYKSMRDAMVKFGITEKDLMQNHITVTNGDLTLEETMGVYIYSRQKEGIHKLISPDGNKLVVKKDKKGNVIKDELLEVRNSLSKDQIAFADWMIEEMGSRYTDVADIYYKVHNKILGKVANYFPFVRKGYNESFNDLMEDHFLTMQENPEDSMTRERTGGDYELQLNVFSVWNKMVAKQEHYIAGAEFFNKLNWMMNKSGGDLYNLIAMNNGKEYATALQDFINRVANKRFIYDDADAMINKVRSNLVVARLGYNVLTMMKQIPALGLFAMQFGPERLFEAITHMTTDYKGTSEFIYEKSPQMRNTSVSIDFSAFTQLESKTKFGRAAKKVGETGMAPIQFIDGFVKRTLWYGAYQNNIAHGMTDEQASMEATRWINDTQPGGSAKDSSAIYDTNSTIMKYLLMFSSQLNKNLNIVYDIPMAFKHGMYEKAFKNMIGLGLSLAGIMAFEGGFSDDDDDDKKWDDFLKGFSAQMVSMLPIFGTDISDIIMDKYYSDSGMPLVSESYSFIKALQSQKKDRIKDRGVNLGLGGAEFVGLPSGQMKKIWDAFTEDSEINLGYLLGNDFAQPDN
jgi:hypothetical protein